MAPSDPSRPGRGAGAECAAESQQPGVGAVALRDSDIRAETEATVDMVTGVFSSPETARAAVARIRRADLAGERVTLLMPGTTIAEVERRVPTEAGESPGMGAALGSVVGGAVGLATASIVIPGVGPIVVAGMLAMTAAGAAGGGVVGDRVEDRLSAGLPEGELSRYAEALRRGQTVLIAAADDDRHADAIRAALRAAGAESIDPARDGWRRDGA
jgi:hypothetical protein